jgi:pyruvate/2-oxoglutarate dehydrogenase complex dihydrolipoamide acyltransferase (E2) component
MFPARIWIVCTCVSLLGACDAPAEQAEPAKPEPAKAEPAQPEPAKAEAPQLEPAQAPAKPLSFTFGARSLEAAVALSSRFNDQRRIVISSMPTTCEQLLAIPEQFQKGNVNFIVTTPWTVGTHPVTSAEILDDDTREMTNIYPKNGTIEVLAAPQGVGERGKIRLTVSAAEGGASGEIDVSICE